MNKDLTGIIIKCYFAFLLIVFLLIAVVASAQTTKPAVKPAPKAPVFIVEGQEDYNLRIPPLDTLIAIAKRTSPTLKTQDALIRKNGYSIRSQKQQWLDGISTDITGGFGNQSLLVQQYNGEVNTFNNFNNGYRIGATLRISLYDVFGSKNQVGMAVSEYEVSRHKKDVLGQEVVGQVTSSYYSLVAAENILKIKSEAKQATSINRLMAEKEFNEGNIAVSELSRIIEISSKAATEYEIAKRDLYENMRLLENLVGIKLF